MGVLRGLPDPENPSTQYLKFLVPKTIPLRNVGYLDSLGEPTSICEGFQRSFLVAVLIMRAVPGPRNSWNPPYLVKSKGMDASWIIDAL